MAITQWIGNGQTTAQVDTITVTAVATNGVLKAQISNKIITYTCTASDTTSTAAANFAALMNSRSAPPEFQQQTYVAVANVITMTADVAGTPFTATFSASGGATLTQTHTTLNSSPSDILNPDNWLRNGVAAIPQNGDDVVVLGTNAPDLLWNLDGLRTVTFKSYTRWQSFQATIGLPDWNPLGYREYRPTYFQFNGFASSSSSPGQPTPITVLLGIGATGSGPSLERYNVGSQATNFIVLASGSASQDFAVYLLGTHGGNTLKAQGASVGIATGQTDVSALQSSTVDGGGSVTYGAGCAVSGTITVNLSGQVGLYTAPSSLQLQNGAQATIYQDGLTIPTLTAQGGSLITYLAGGTISNLTLQTSSRLDKSQDLRTLTISTSEVDGDTCQVNDPNSVIVWSTATVVNGQVTTGPFLTGPGRQWKIT